MYYLFENSNFPPTLVFDQRVYFYLPFWKICSFLTTRNNISYFGPLIAYIYSAYVKWSEKEKGFAWFCVGAANMNT